jgi:phytoene dehydrogenase-like protein
MAESYDVVFIGSGHNGLICAAYLAKAGLKTINLERREVIGGGAATEEVTLPGFKHNVHSTYHGFIQLGPVLKDLEVSRYHKYVFPDPPWCLVFSDKRSILQHVGKGIEPIERTCKTIAQFSEKDAKTYKELYKMHYENKDLYIAWMYNPPLPPSQQFYPFEGTEAGRELLRMQLSSYKDVVYELFESDQMRAFMLIAIVQMGVGVEEYGTGQWVPLMVTLEHDPGWGLSVGGSNTLAQALGRIVEENGGKIRVNSEVREIIIKDGVAVGVKLDNGKEIMANKAIVSNIDPAGTFIKLIGEDMLDPEFLKKVKRYRPGISTITPHYALNDQPRWVAAEKNPDVNKSWGVFIGETSEIVLDFYRSLKAGKIPDRPEDLAFLTVMCTIWDPSQAPAGKHTAFYWCHSPYNLRDGGPEKWDEIKEWYADLCEEAWRRYAPNMTKDNILKRYVDSPLDLERRMPQLFKGCWLMGDITQDQMGIFRPFHGYSPYKTPVDNLYMCGSCTHPSGAITGGPGYNCAGVIADDFKIKKWWKPISVGKG